MGMTQCDQVTDSHRRRLITKFIELPAYDNIGHLVNSAALVIVTGEVLLPYAPADMHLPLGTSQYF